MHIFIRKYAALMSIAVSAGLMAVSAAHAEEAAAKGNVLKPGAYTRRAVTSDFGIKADNKIMRLSEVTAVDSDRRIKANIGAIKEKYETVTAVMAGYFFALDEERYAQLMNVLGMDADAIENSFSRLRSDGERWTMGNAIGGRKFASMHVLLAAMPFFRGAPGGIVLKNLNQDGFEGLIAENKETITRIAEVMVPVASSVFIPSDILANELKVYGADVNSDTVWEVAEKNGWAIANGEHRVLRGDFFFALWLGALNGYTW